MTLERNALALLLFVSTSASASAQTWEAEASAVFTASANTGFVVEAVGDLDGDGLGDGAITKIGAAQNRGRVFLVSSDGTEIRRFTGSTPGDNLGHSVAGVGDADGDGVSDVVAGAPVLTGVRPGLVTLYSGATGDVLWTVQGEAVGDRFGWVVAGPGDVDGDGRGDVIVGAPQHDQPSNNCGKAYVYSGATGELLHSWTGLGAGDWLGASVGSAGDRDGDGHVDLLACARFGGASNQGLAFVYSGADGSLMCTLAPPGGGTDFGNYFGGCAGDVDADGIPDPYVIDYSFPNQRGTLYVYSGSDCSLLHRIRAPIGGTFLFGRVRIGDIDGDGHDDLLTCSGQSNVGPAQAGAVYLHSGATGESLGQFTGDTPGMRLGTDVCSIGDVTGDGVPDIFVGVGDVTGSGQGGAFVLPGGPNPPRVFCHSTDASTGTEARLGYLNSLSVSANSFELRCEAAPAGQIGVFFGGPNTANVPFGNGIRCVGTPLRRYGAANASDTGDVQFQVDFSRGPASTILIGVPWHMQFWFRDPAAGGSNFNFSSGLRAVFRN